MVLFFKWMLFSHSHTMSTHSHIEWPTLAEDTSNVSTDSSSVSNMQYVWAWRRSRLRAERESVLEKESIVSRLKLAIAADWDVRSGGSCSSALCLRATIAGLRAAQVVRGARQQVGVMAALLMGAVRWALRGQEGGILLYSGWRERYKNEVPN